jgi:hypothetical protein
MFCLFGCFHGDIRFSSSNKISGPVYNDLVFGGISLVDQKGDTSVRLSWVPHAEAIGYDVYDLSSGSRILMTTVGGQATSSVTLTGLTPGMTYIFRVALKDGLNQNDANTNDHTVQMDSAPPMASGLSLLSPALTTSFTSTPVIRVTGVRIGDTVEIYTGAGCVTRYATGVAAATTIDLTLDPLPAGTYTFYARTFNGVGGSCTSDVPLSVSYTRFTCPTGYVPVPADSNVGAPDEFCVMQFEAKDVGGYPESRPDIAPWGNVSQNTAKAACTSLNTRDGLVDKYDLISNPEWMAIARNIEAQASNWIGGVLKRGNSGTNDSVGYDGWNSGDFGVIASFSADRVLKAKHVLGNGTEIWDIAGNLWEWVDYTIGGVNATTPSIVPNNQKAYASGDGAPVAGAIEFDLLDSNIGPGDPMNPSVWRSETIGLNSNDGIGAYFAGLSGSGGAMARGGNYGTNANTGIYTLAIDRASTFTHVAFGFRCVYRP